MEDNCIYKIEDFICDNKRVKCLTKINDESCKKFYGSVFIEIENDTIPFDFEFESEINSLQECFSNFESSIEKFIQKKRNEQKIITNNKNGGNLIIP